MIKVREKVRGYREGKDNFFKYFISVYIISFIIIYIVYLIVIYIFKIVILLGWFEISIMIK